MSPLDLIIVTGSLSGATGYLLAWRIHRVVKPTQEQLQQYMDRVVAVEDSEAREHRMRTIAQRAHRRTMENPESGPPARVSRAIAEKGGPETFFKKK